MDKITEARLLAAADKEEIRDALYRYCRGIDRGDADMMKSAYHLDAIEHHGSFYDGPARDYCDFVIEHLTTVPMARHELTNILIELDGQSARVESYFLSYQRVNGRAADDFIGGRYLDRFSHRNGEWLIAERTIVFDWTGLVTFDEASPYAESFPRGSRDSEDPLYNY
ncbi:gamma-BHC dehydrochlorinase [Luminiphilus syltensis NOR5-1B]|uniref:Gamma-BHC dehydrochlorinase n=1 Tax=Luminiphilus syltensis NOR5-1B TaxID=565045 RepID=B8KYL2_9GAMM|nr:nuclear transport factor 2 family protein [Luminiphilus syltensis]EED35913.1 gamma-BHC dehydrochlorinase [Luminiphilus syltensis NOR5-1B]